MKKLMLLWVMFMLITAAHAQFSQGNWMFSGDFSYQQSTFPKNPPNAPLKEMDFNLRPRIGFMVSDHWAMGLQGGFNSYTRVSPGKQGYAPYFFSMGEQGTGVISVERLYHGAEANQLWSIGPYLQRFFPLGEKTFLHLLANVDYQSGRGAFSPDMFIMPMRPGIHHLASSYILPDDRSFTERNWIAGLQMGLSHFFTPKVALDVQASLLEWQRMEIEDSKTIWESYDPFITRTESTFKTLPRGVGLRFGIIVLL